MNNSGFGPEITITAPDNIDNVLPNATVNDVMQLRSDVAYLELSIWTSKLFINHLINKKIKLSTVTIDEIENNMHEGLNYFST